MAQKTLPQRGPVSIFTRDHSIKLFLLCFAVWLHAASSLLAATTLPSAIREFGGGNLIGWAFALYLLGSIFAGSSTGTLMRYCSLRMSLGLAALLYLIGSLICAVAPDMNVVLAGRLCQGIGGGYLVALAYVAIRQWFTPDVLPKVMALISAVWSMSAFAGPLVGGTFATFGNWRLAYVAAVVQAAIFVVLALTTAPMLMQKERAEPGSIPVMTLALICLSVLSVAFAGAEVHGLHSLLLCGLGVALFAAALKRDSKVVGIRLFPSKPLNIRHRVGAGLVLILTASISSMSFMVYGPIMLETLHEITPLAAGYIIAFESVGWGGAAIFVAWINPSNEARLIQLGTACLLGSLLGFALTMGSGPVWLIVALAGIQGTGFGMMWAFIVNRITEAARAAEANETSSAIPTMQQIGFAFGAAAAGIVANTFGFGEDVSALAAQSAAFWIFAAFVPFAVIACVAGWRLAR
ncbi:MFS transporter [Roseovarius sp. EL26]|uniref:MFS transporter n=1 Tax=Roseovarius sp. EL26 TaxID=2126672 RepID=UPI000EA08B06|nr:MFS transporter [Roseovarius sp. EL26]